MTPEARGEPTTEAARMLLLAESQIAWPDEYTFIAISALTPMFAAIEAEARAEASADLDRLRAVERAVEHEWQRAYQSGYAPTEAETAVTDALGRIRAALGDRPAEEGR